MSSEGLVSERIGDDSVNSVFWPRCSSGATVRNSAAAWYWSVPPSRVVRKPAEFGHGRGVLEADHHVADRPVADVGDHPADGHDGLAGSGDDLRGDLIDPHLDEGDRAGFARGGGGQHRAGSRIPTTASSARGRPPESRRRRTAVNPSERAVPQPRLLCIVVGGYGPGP